MEAFSDTEHEKNISQDSPKWLPRGSKTTPGGTKSNQNGIKISKNPSKSNLFSKKVLNVNWSLAKVNGWHAARLQKSMIGRVLERILSDF